MAKKHCIYCEHGPETKIDGYYLICSSCFHKILDNSSDIQRILEILENKLERDGSKEKIDQVLSYISAVQEFDEKWKKINRDDKHEK